MPQEQAKACVELMSQWSEAAKAAFVKVPAKYATKCAAKAVSQCSELGAKTAFKNSMTKDKFDYAQKEIENKVTIKADAIKQVDGIEEKTAERLARKVAKPARYRWVRIPGFKVGDGNVPAKDMSQCRIGCARHGRCVGFSYSETFSRCVWSTVRIHYEHKYNLFVKNRESNSSPQSFTTIPGIRMGEIVLSTEEKTRLKLAHLGGSSQEDRDALIEQRSENECALKCLKAGGNCVSFSYSEQFKKCFISGTSIEMGSKWDYYEREAAEFPGPQIKYNYMEVRQREEKGLIQNLIGRAEDNIREFEGAHEQPEP